MHALMQRFRPVVLLLLAIWATFAVQFFTGDLLLALGLEPRTLRGIDGVLFSPFLHGSFTHLLSNSAGLAMLGGLVSVHRPHTFLTVSLFVAVLGGAATWLFGRSAVHIGASGMIFGYLGYLLMRGWVERTPKSVLIAAVVAIFYGGLIWGVLPTRSGVSWEAHLFGFLAGVLAARWRIHTSSNATKL